MQSRDYLVRQLETFTRALAQAIFLRESRREATAAVVLEELSERFLGLRASDLTSLSYASLVARLGAGDDADVDRRLMAADLLYEIALLREAQGSLDAALDIHVLSFRLLAEIRADRGPEALDGRDPRLDAIARAIRGADLDRETLVLAWRHHAAAGRFGFAEDALFRAIEAPASDGAGGRELVEEGIAAYEVLLGMPDATLVAGGLSREEVVEGLEELRRL